MRMTLNPAPVLGSTSVRSARSRPAALIPDRLKIVDSSSEEPTPRTDWYFVLVSAVMVALPLAPPIGASAWRGGRCGGPARAGGGAGVPVAVLGPVPAVG